MQRAGFEMKKSVVSVENLKQWQVRSRNGILTKRKNTFVNFIAMQEKFSELLKRLDDLPEDADINEGEKILEQIQASVMASFQRMEIEMENRKFTQMLNN